MKIRPELDKKIQDTLDSLDGMERAEPRPFFYTRLMGRLQQNERTVWETVSSFLSRPAVAVASLCLIFILNAFLVFRQDSSVQSSNQGITSGETTLTTDNEYILASSTSFEYENFDQ